MGESAREGVELSGVEKQGEWESDAKLRGRVVRVSVLRRESVCAGENTCDGEHVQTEDTCQRDTSDTSGQQWAYRLVDSARSLTKPVCNQGFDFPNWQGTRITLVSRLKARDPRPVLSRPALYTPGDGGGEGGT